MFFNPILILSYIYILFIKKNLYVGGQKRSGATAAASSFTGVSSLFSQASKLSDEEDEDYSTPRKKLRLAKDQILALEDTFKVHSTLNPVSFFLFFFL